MDGAYYKTKESVEEYVRLAKDVNGSEIIKKLAAFLPEGSNLLELGSGPGTDWRLLNELYNVTGSDNSVEFLNHLRKSNPKGEFVELDASTLNTHKKVDGIYSNKVLHHLSNEQLSTSVKRQSEILNPNGIVCHSFWKGEGSEVFKGLFVNYFKEKDLSKFFSEYFEILSLSVYPEFEEGDSILLIAKKK